MYIFTKNWFNWLKATRIRPGTNLDLILTNEEAMIQNISYTVGLGSSDHTCIQFYLNCTATRSARNTTGYDFGRANFDQMKDMLYKK